MLFWCRERKADLIFLQETHSINYERGIKYYFLMAKQVPEVLRCLERTVLISKFRLGLH